MLCRLCDRDQRLARAHVIPEGFFRRIRHPAETLELLTPGEPPKKAPIGVYDQTILCPNCDNVFSPWEQHAQEVLLRNFDADAVAILYGSDKIGWTVHRYDYRALKLFFVSVLWRASISTHTFYARITTGPFEQELREMILAADPGDPEKFAVTLAKFDEPAYTAILNPHRERWEGINYCRFYLAGFVAHIKLDRRPPPDFLGSFILRPEPPIVVLRQSRKSKDAEAMRDLARVAWEWKRSRSKT